jgi:nucleoside-diphosphate kinase
VTELSSGTSVLAIVRGESVVSRLREVVGPFDPEIARHLRPKSVRSLFGVDRVKNAVLCTDLPDDGPLECKFFFVVMD